jgi:hypothetical protein
MREAILQTRPDAFMDCIEKLYFVFVPLQPGGNEKNLNALVKIIGAPAEILKYAAGIQEY